MIYIWDCLFDKYFFNFEFGIPKNNCWNLGFKVFRVNTGKHRTFEPECRIKRQPNEVGQELVVKRNKTNNSVYQLVIDMLISIDRYSNLSDRNKP